MELGGPGCVGGAVLKVWSRFSASNIGLGIVNSLITLELGLIVELGGPGCVGGCGVEGVVPFFGIQHRAGDR